jgi:2-iminoacetate synthase ThiH
VPSFQRGRYIIDMRYFRELLPLLAVADVDLSLFHEVKANLTRDQIRMLSEAGVNSIQPGIEEYSGWRYAFTHKPKQVRAEASL